MGSIYSRSPRLTASSLRPFGRLNDPHITQDNMLEVTWLANELLSIVNPPHDYRAHTHTQIKGVVTMTIGMLYQSKLCSKKNGGACNAILRRLSCNADIKKDKTVRQKTKW